MIKEIVQALLRVRLLWPLLLLGGCVIQPFDNLEEWQEIRSSNFIVYTNASKAVAFDAVKELEAFRATALQMLTIPNLQKEKPVRVYLFKNQSSYKPFQITDNVLGYFIPKKNYIVLYAVLHEPEHQNAIIYHEYIHYLTSKHPDAIPRWYDEGLATMFETFKIDQGLVTFGKAQLVRWQFLKRAEWIPMDEFLSGQTSFHKNKGFTHAHSQAWALMHYFFYEPGNLEKLGQYLYMINNQKEYDEALQLAFGFTPEELLREVQNYVARGKLPYSTIKLDDINVMYSQEIRALDEKQAKKIIQDLLSQVENFKKQEK